jgi:hypothetical protein
VKSWGVVALVGTGLYDSARQGRQEAASAGLGTLYRRTGKPEHAKEHLTTAAAMYSEMDMTYWLKKLEKDM